MGWKELIDESKIGAAGGVAGIDSSGRLAIPAAGFDRDIAIADLIITKEDIGLGKVENLSAAEIYEGLTADYIPELDLAQVAGLIAALDSKVPTTRKVAGQALTGDITLAKGDVGLGKVENLSATEIYEGLTADYIPELDLAQVAGLIAALDSKVPTTRKVAGKALTADVSLTKADVGLGNVENEKPGEILKGLKVEHIVASGAKTSDLISEVTTLPMSGAPGEIVMKSGMLFVWRE